MPNMQVHSVRMHRTAE